MTENEIIHFLNETVMQQDSLEWPLAYLLKLSIHPFQSCLALLPEDPSPDRLYQESAPMLVQTALKLLGLQVYTAMPC